MGLISRLRRPTTERANPPDPGATTERPVLRAEDLRGPGWTQLPPPAPLLPPVPFVFSHRFQDQLVSWTPPQRFVGQLRHAVSPEAPSGVVEAIAVLAPEQLDEDGRDGGGPELVYAIRGGERPGPEVETRTQTLTPRYRPVFAVTPNDVRVGTPDAGGTQGTPGDAAGPMQPQTRPAEAPAPASVPPAEPGSLIARAERVAVGRPDLRTAPVPPSLPLVQLRAEASEPPRAAAPGSPPGHDNEAPILSARVGADVLPAGPPLDEPPLSGDAHRPLANPDTAAPSPTPTTRPYPGPPVPAAPAEQPEPPVRRRQPGEPLRRSGLGAPIAGLPATAAGFDPATLIKSSKGRARITALSQTGGMPKGMGRAISAALGSGPPAKTAAPDGTAGPMQASPPGGVATWGELPLVAFGGQSEAAVVPLEALDRPDETSTTRQTTGLPPAIEPSAPLLTFAALAEPAPHPDGSTAAPGAQGQEGSFVRAEVGARHGIDLSHVPIDRSPAAASEARAMGARGYSSSAGVAIPPELGSLDSGPGAALLAHELTHVAQQARLGPHSPAEATPAGRSLEAEALETEMKFAPVPMAAAAPRAASALPTGRARALPSVPTPAGPGHGAPVPAALPVAAAHRSAGVDRDTLASMLQAITTPAPASHAPALASAFAPAPPPMAAAAPATAGVQRALEPSGPDAAVAAAASQVGAPPGSAAHDPDAGPFSKRPGDKELERLAAWLYPLISFKIRTELRDGRERAGMLTDTYGRW